MQEMFGYVGGTTRIRITRISNMLLYPCLELAGSASNVTQITGRTSYRVHNMVRVAVNESLNCAMLTTDGILDKGSFDSVTTHWDSQCLACTFCGILGDNILAKVGDFLEENPHPDFRIVSRE